MATLGCCKFKAAIVVDNNNKPSPILRHFAGVEQHIGMGQKRSGKTIARRSAANPFMALASLCMSMRP
jgi:hypothetical protein